MARAETVETGRKEAPALAAPGGVDSGAALAAMKMSKPTMMMAVTYVGRKGYRPANHCSEMGRSLAVASSKWLC